MIDKYTNSSINSPMWWVFASKIFFSVIGFVVLVFFLFTPLTNILFLFGIPPNISFVILLLCLTAYVVYYLIKTILGDLPSQWTQNVEIDFIKKEIEVNLDTFGFHEIYRMVAKEYSSDLFPSYYKIWAEFEKGRKIKVLSLKNPDEYTNLLKLFHEAGIPVN